MKTYYIIASLPHSGDDVLSKILNQNPNFSSEPQSAVLDVMIATEQTLGNSPAFNANPKKEVAFKMIAGVIDNYYSDVDEPVIFDKNTAWLSRFSYINGYLGAEPKVVCLVRDIKEIMALYVDQCNKSMFDENGNINPIDGQLIRMGAPITNEYRCELIASNEGVLGVPYGVIRQAIMGGHQNSIHFVEYKDLINNTQETIAKIYEFLGQEMYEEHDFSGIEEVSIDVTEVLSEDTIARTEGADFWNHLEDFVSEEDETCDGCGCDECKTETEELN